MNRSRLDEMSSLTKPPADGPPAPSSQVTQRPHYASTDGRPQPRLSIIEREPSQSMTSSAILPDGAPSQPPSPANQRRAVLSIDDEFADSAETEATCAVWPYRCPVLVDFVQDRMMRSRFVVVVSLTFLLLFSVGSFLADGSFSITSPNSSSCRQARVIDEPECSVDNSTGVYTLIRQNHIDDNFYPVALGLLPLVWLANSRQFVTASRVFVLPALALLVTTLVLASPAIPFCSLAPVQPLPATETPLQYVHPRCVDSAGNAYRPTGDYVNGTWVGSVCDELALLLCEAADNSEAILSFVLLFVSLCLLFLLMVIALLRSLPTYVALVRWYFCNSERERERERGSGADPTGAGVHTARATQPRSRPAKKYVSSDEAMEVDEDDALPPGQPHYEPSTATRPSDPQRRWSGSHAHAWDQALECTTSTARGWVRRLACWTWDEHFLFPARLWLAVVIAVLVLLIVITDNVYSFNKYLLDAGDVGRAATQAQYVSLSITGTLMLFHIGYTIYCVRRDVIKSRDIYRDLHRAHLEQTRQQHRKGPYHSDEEEAAVAAINRREERARMSLSSAVQAPAPAPPAEPSTSAVPASPEPGVHAALALDANVHQSFATLPAKSASRALAVETLDEPVSPLFASPELHVEYHRMRLHEKLSQSGLYNVSYFVGSFVSTTLFGFYLCWFFLFLIFMAFIWDTTRNSILSNWETLLQFGFAWLVRWGANRVMRRCVVGSNMFRIQHPRLFATLDLVLTFVGALAGPVTAVSRICMALGMAVFNIIRLDASVLPRRIETYDSAHMQYVAVIHAAHFRQNY